MFTACISLKAAHQGSNEDVPPRLALQIRGGTNGLNVAGEVTVNGERMSRSFFLENASYVPQEDRLWSALTGKTIDSYTHALGHLGRSRATPIHFAPNTNESNSC